MDTTEQFVNVWRASVISQDALKHSIFVKPHCKFSPTMYVYKIK